MSRPELIVAGYVRVRPAPCPPGLESVPDTILTISDCIMDTLPRPECWDWYQSPTEAFAADANTSPDDLLVAVVIAESDAPGFIDETGGPTMPFHALLRTETPAEGALLGYELVGAEATLDFHSWHCYGVAEQLNAALGIRVNDHGLIDDYSDAQRALDWMLDLPAEDAVAPVPWTIVGLTVVGPTPEGTGTR